MNFIYSLFAAFSMFSALPAPQVPWEKEKIRYMLVAMPLIGAVKTPQEAELFRQYLGLGERFTAQVERLQMLLAQDPDTLLLDVEAIGPDAARAAVRRWIDEYL